MNFSIEKAEAALEHILASEFPSARSATVVVTRNQEWFQLNGWTQSELNVEDVQHTLKKLTGAKEPESFTVYVMDFYGGKRHTKLLGGFVPRKN
jgi:hypothetical protein